MKQFRRAAAGLLAAGMLLALSGCTPGPEQNHDTVLTIGTADSGGTMYPVGSAIARVLEQDQVKVNVSASSGSTMNAQTLLKGEVDLALISGDMARAAYDYPDGAGRSLTAVGAVFVSQSNWLAPEASELTYVHELGGKKLGVGPERSTTEMTALAALEGAGLGAEQAELTNCGLGEEMEKVASGELDAIHGFSGAPIRALAQLAEETPCRVLQYTDEELKAILTQNEIFAPAVLPADTYKGQHEAVDTFGVKCLLCVDASMDEELVWQLTRALYENRTALAGEHKAMTVMSEDGFMNENLPIPLHPGAQRYYDSLT